MDCNNIKKIYYETCKKKQSNDNNYKQIMICIELIKKLGISC